MAEQELQDAKYRIESLEEENRALLEKVANTRDYISSLQGTIRELKLEIEAGKIKQTALPDAE